MLIGEWYWIVWLDTSQEDSDIGIQIGHHPDWIGWVGTDPEIVKYTNPLIANIDCLKQLDNTRIQLREVIILEGEGSYWILLFGLVVEIGLVIAIDVKK